MKKNARSSAKNSLPNSKAGYYSNPYSRVSFLSTRPSKIRSTLKTLARQNIYSAHSTKAIRSKPRLRSQISDLSQSLKQRNALAHKVVSPATLSPFKSLICSARKLRRAVIFANKKQGGNHKPPTFTTLSLIRC